MEFVREWACGWCENRPVFLDKFPKNVKKTKKFKIYVIFLTKTYKKLAHVNFCKYIIFNDLRVSPIILTEGCHGRRTEKTKLYRRGNMGSIPYRTLWNFDSYGCLIFFLPGLFGLAFLFFECALSR